METFQKKPFEIKDNVLVGEKVWIPPNQLSYINIGDLILKTFKSYPNFIGQIDAETGEQNTFKQMKERSIKCALWMLKFGIKSNDVITICSHNQLNAYIPFLAALYIGAVVNPIDEHFVKGNLVYFLKQTKPKILFIDEKFSATAKASMWELRKIGHLKLVIFGKTDYYKPLESILNDDYNSASIENFLCTKMLSMKSTAIRLFTPGTTASPKDIELPRSAFLVPPGQLAPYMRLNDVGLWFESLGFINGIFMTIQAILSTVKVIKIKSKFHTKNLCKLIEEHKVTWMFLESSMCTQLIKSGDLSRYDVTSLRTVVFSGSVINKRIVYDGFKKWLPNTFISQTYSLTETGIIAYQQQSRRPGSSGYVSGHVQLKIVSLDPSDKQKSLGPNILGEICCTSPYIMIRKNHETCDGQFYSNWFRTGDLGSYDKNGEIHIRGRINELYKYNVHYVLPILTEYVLQSHSAVSEAAVIPVPSKLNEEHLMAFVTKVPGKEVTEEELQQFVVGQENLDHKYQLRAGVIFLSQLPRLPNGKIHRKLLHDWAQTYMYE